MIIGDPFKFAIQFDSVNEWNSDNFWRNGAFSLYINGVRLPDLLDVIELRVTLACYVKLEKITTVSGNEKLSAEHIYKTTNSYLFGDGLNYIEGVYDLTCTAMSDVGCHAYWLGRSDSEIFVWSSNDGKRIESVSLPGGTFHAVASKLRRVLEMDLGWL